MFLTESLHDYLTRAQRANEIRPPVLLLALASHNAQITLFAYPTLLVSSLFLYHVRRSGTAAG
jgi:hypothetical protein